jgi:hypothetical protein
VASVCGFDSHMADGWVAREGAQCSHRCLHHGSLWNNKIGDAGARDLGAALRVNTTLTELR